MKSKQLSENALEVTQNRYFMNGEDWEACTLRVADTLSINDKPYKEKFHEILCDMDFIPGGRILRNSGRPRGSLFNCYHLPIGDSIDEIGTLMKDALTLWSEGGGVGVNFSPLRPKGDIIVGKGGNSSGLVSFIEAIDAIADTVESGGSRRAAAIAHVDINHPEILDVINAKLKDKKLSHFNISAVINEVFLDAVEQNKNWEFRFKQRKYGSKPASDIWNQIIENMVNCAEPGLINWDTFSKNNSWYFAPILGTNPCGETVLEAYGICCLGSLVLPNFITGKVNTNWIKLENTIELAVRMLDNVIDINKYVLKENDIAAHNSRRIGLGVMGLAEYLFAKGVKYGSVRAVQETERLMRFIRDKSYEASIKLAQEKGSFSKFESIPFSKSSFVKKLPAQIRMDIKRYGMRNVTTMACAPTGTISLVAECTPGIEPLFAKAYNRHDRVSDRIYVHPMYEQMIQSGEKIPEWFVDALNDLKPEDHFEMQVAVQRYVDGSVSKTINLPKDTTTEQLSGLLLEYIRDLKGCTVYRDGSREGQILEQISEEDILKYLKEQKVTKYKDILDVQCPTGKCEI